MNTLLLDLENWDLVVNSAGNIATAYDSAPTAKLEQRTAYAIAQDVASEVRLFLGELWYETARGIPYVEQILGQPPSLQFMKAQFVAAALRVPGVAQIKCFLIGLDPNRNIGGQLQITEANTGLITLVQTASIHGEAPWYVSAVSPEASA